MATVSGCMHAYQTRRADFWQVGLVASCIMSLAPTSMQLPYCWLHFSSMVAEKGHPRAAPPQVRRKRSAVSGRQPKIAAEMCG